MAPFGVKRKGAAGKLAFSRRARFNRLRAAAMLLVFES
jgi:hypothetical protein